MTTLGWCLAAAILGLLLLAGGVGVGKSVAAAYAIKRRAGRWLSAPDVGRLSGFENAEDLWHREPSRGICQTDAVVLGGREERVGVLVEEY